MSEEIPCLSERDSCSLREPCVLKRAVDDGHKSIDWLRAQTRKCSELTVRREGWQHVRESES